MVPVKAESPSEWVGPEAPQPAPAETLLLSWRDGWRHVLLLASERYPPAKPWARISSSPSQRMVPVPCSLLDAPTGVSPPQKHQVTLQGVAGTGRGTSSLHSLQQARDCALDPRSLGQILGEAGAAESHA